MSSSNIASAVRRLILPYADALGLDVWDVRFVREAGCMYLRIFIDKEGGINITDCENLSRAIDAPLDDADLIQCQYCLEVSSTGPERELSRPEHFAKMEGRTVKLRLFRPLEDGSKELCGLLTGYDSGNIRLLCGETEMIINKNEAAFVRLCDEELFNGGMTENE